MSTHNFRHLIFDTKNIHQKKEASTNWMSSSRIIILDLYQILCARTTSKLITDLDVKLEILELLEENVGSALHDVCRKGLSE